MAVRAGDFGRSPVLRAIGWSLSVAGILLIGWQFISTEAMGIVVDGGWALPRAVLGAAVGYAMALTLLAIAWSMALEVPIGLDRTTAHFCAIYLVSQIAKYIPGNVFHFIGRHALGLRAGVDHARLLRSGLIEVAGLVSAAGILLLLTGRLRGAQSLALLGQASTWALAGTIVVACLGLGFLLTLTQARREGIRALILMRVALKVLPLYVGFFLCSGLILWCLALALGFGADEPAAAIGAAAGAWIVGYLTPGAPAGIGVRDASLGALLAQMGPSGQTAVCVLAYRVATLVGDVLAWLAGAALLNWLEPPKASANGDR